MPNVTHDDACTGDCAAAGLRTDLVLLSAEAVRLDRRGFLTQSMLAAAAVALSACGEGAADFISAPVSVASTVRVADYSALATVGGVALVTLKGSALAVVRTGSDTFVVLSRACPHEGATINVSAGGSFQCPRHGAQFNATGTWTGGRRTSSMRSYPATYDAAMGVLTVV